MRDFLSLEVGEFLERAVLLHHHDQVVALELFFVALDRERHRPGDVHRKRGRAGREPAHVQASRAHGLDLSRVRLHLVEHHALAGAACEVVGEGLEHLLIDRRVFHRGVGKNQRVRGLQLLRVFRRVGDQVAVFVAVLRIQVAAILAGVLGERACGKQRGCNGPEAGLQQCAFHVASLYANGHFFFARAASSAARSLSNPARL